MSTASFLELRPWQAVVARISWHTTSGTRSGATRLMSMLELTFVRFLILINMKRTKKREIFLLISLSDTPSTGAETSLWCYADFRLPYVERLAKLLQPDTLKIDVGEPGSIETTFVDYGIPSLTVEMGEARVWNTSLIDRVVAYVDRVMIDLAMTPSNATVEPDLSNTYMITTFHDTYTQHGGFVEMLVAVDQPVSKGQPIAHVRNPFGDILETLVSPEDGRMFSIPRDPSVEPGASVGEIAYNSTDPACADGCILSGPQRRR